MIPMSITKVVPGLLVKHQYGGTVSLVLSTTWNSVEVLNGNSRVVRWEMDSFRSVYEVVNETR